MIRYLLKHQWLNFRRSASFERELGLAIFIAILGGLIFFGLVFLAFALPGIVEQMAGGDDPVPLITLGTTYYFVGELFMRYFLQGVPAMDVMPYLGLPIRRRLISVFLIGKSLLSPFNVLSLLLVLPLSIKVLLPQYGGLATTSWLLCIFSISLGIHFVNILFRKKLEDMPIVWVILVLVVASNYLLNTYLHFDLLEPLASALAAVLQFPALALVPLMLVVWLAFISIRFFDDNLYGEEIGNKQVGGVETYSEMFGFLGTGDLANAMVLQEIRLILRHKRTRSVLWLSLIFVGYGLLFFRKGETNLGWHVFSGVFMTGLFTINYGQFFWSWTTNQFDFFLSKPISVNVWVMSRYRILAIATLACAVLTIPYVYFGWEVLLAIMAGWLYNLGINIPLMMRMALWSPKAIDLNKGAFMNYEGTGTAQWVMGFPVLVGPFVFYVPFKILFGHVEGLCAVAVAGIIGFALRDYFFRLIVEKFKALKYKLIHDLSI